MLRWRLNYIGEERLGRVQKVVMVMLGLASLCFMIGVFAWGYRVNQIAVNGVPVVKATLDSFRERPSDPGGRETRHTGLTVNSVSGELAEPPLKRDNIRFAPRNIGLDSISD